VIVPPGASVGAAVRLRRPVTVERDVRDDHAERRTAHVLLLQFDREPVRLPRAVRIEISQARVHGVSVGFVLAGVEHKEGHRPLAQRVVVAPTWRLDEASKRPRLRAAHVVIAACEVHGRAGRVRHISRIQQLLGELPFRADVVEHVAVPEQ